MLSKKGIKNLILEGIDSLTIYEDFLNVNNIESDLTNEHKHFTQNARDFINKTYSNGYLTDKYKAPEDELAGIVSFDAESGKAYLEYEIGYNKVFLATKKNEYVEFIKDNNFFLIPIVLQTIIITKDNKIILRLGEDNFYKLSNSFIRKEDIVSKEIIDFKHSISREIENQIGKVNTYENKILGIMYQHKTFRLFIKSRVNYTSKELLNIANKNNINNKFMFIDFNEDKLKESIKNNQFGFAAKTGIGLILKTEFRNYNFVSIK